ncbi:MAG: thiolase family protein [Chloroflexota bacterium]
MSMRNVVVLGVGMTQFGRFPGTPVPKIGAEAVVFALKDAGIPWKTIPMMYCAHSMGGIVDGEMVEAEIGHTGIPIINVSNACTGGNTAVFLAYQAIALGLYDMVMAMGVDQAPHGPLGQGSPPHPFTVLGVSNMLVKHAQKMQRAIYEKRLTLDQIAKVSVKTHNNGCLNPRAQYKLPLKSVEEVHKSRMICDPLTLYHCCPTGDGAAAIILCTEEVARKYTTPPFIRLIGGALATQVFIRGETDNTRDSTVRAAKKAYPIAGIGPEDVDMVELHDNFTISELDHYEDLQLCGEGEAGKLIDEGATEITGRIPVNMSGGLLAKGHPTSATGVAQICELTWQLRGQAGERQVKDPKVGIAHCAGGDEGHVASVNFVLK